MSDLANRVLGRYQLLVAVARGGMGQVWLGRLQGARGFSKLVAVKTLLPEQGDLARLEAMLAEEARIASLIQHSNVVHTIELGEHEGLLYLVMEWVDGESLGFLLDRAEKRGGMPRGVAVQLVSQLLAGLHAAHELSGEAGPLGVVHRDVSPQNILVTYDGVAKLLDFGIAKATHQTSSNTENGEIKGKFSYMAPEQILGNPVDRRCDIFAAGVVLYLLTTGRHPFKSDNTATVIHAITTNAPVPAPSSFVEDYPSELEQVLLKALAKDPEQRWSNAEEMRLALRAALPDAFSDAGRAELASFMETAVGDRKVARREAVRRAQVAADASEIGSGSRASIQLGAQSASSLRAISISQPAPQEASQLIVTAPDVLEGSTPPAPRPSKLPWLAALAGVMLAVGATVPRFFKAPGTAQAAGGIEAGTLLPASRSNLAPSQPTALAAVAPAPESPVASVTASALPAASQAATPAAAPKAGKKPAAKSKASAPRPSDLLTPDY